jgi:flagellar basal-body rod protein FlgB
MLLNKLFERTAPGIEKALDLTWRRNEAITANIANAETPMYRAVDVNFSSELSRAFGASQSEVSKTHSSHMDLSASSGAHLIPDLSGMTKPDGNNVDIDLQMGRLAQNSSKYTQAANLLRKQFQTLNSAIRQIG